MIGNYRRWVQSLSATLYLFSKRWGVCNGLLKTDLLHGRPEGGDVLPRHFGVVFLCTNENGGPKAAVFQT
jgi:hypothetical protein